MSLFVLGLVSLGYYLRGYYMFSTEISPSGAVLEGHLRGKDKRLTHTLIERLTLSVAPLFSPPTVSLSRSPFPRPLSFARS